MVIVVEYTLAISFILSYLIIKVTAAILSKKSRFTIISSLFAAFLSIFSPILRENALIKLALIICSMILILLISFKYTSFKDFLLCFAILTFATFLFGGGCYALEGIVGAYPLYIVALAGGGIYFVTTLLIKIVRRAQNIKKFTFSLTLKDGKKVLNEEGYLDSGNVLYDPITKKPIILVNFDVFHKLYENVSYFNALTRSIDEKKVKNGHYMKINSVGRGGTMLVFSIDELLIEGDSRQYKNALLGLSFSGFEKSFGKNVLLHCDYA